MTEPKFPLARIADTGRTHAPPHPLTTTKHVLVIRGVPQTDSGRSGFISGDYEAKTRVGTAFLARKDDMIGHYRPQGTAIGQNL